MFELIPVPTPFQIGDVNAYVADNTVVDPGPNSDPAWTALTDGLADLGHEPADISRVVITHPHPDHFGLATRFHDVGATVTAGIRSAPIVEDFEGRYAYERAYFSDYFVHHGMAPEAVKTTLGLPEQFLKFAPSVPVDITVTDGDTLELLDREVTIRATKGHALEELILCYADTGGDHAIVGDHVLADITPNPVLQPPDARDERRPRMLPAFNRSLESLKSVGFDRFLPGHRDPIDDPGNRIESILAAHERRTANVLELVREPRSAFEVMEGLFDDLPVTEYFAGMSEAIGHLDVLVERDQVRRQEHNGTIRYTQTS